MLGLYATTNTGIHFNTISQVALKFTSASLLVIKDESLTRRSINIRIDLNFSFHISQESCARTLLFRGADKDALNYAGQTPYQVAVIAANLELADVIQNHRPEDVGKLDFYDCDVTCRQILFFI